MMSTAALLAGTLAAASQSIQPGGSAQEKGQPGRSQGVKSNEVKEGAKGAQAQPSSEEGKGQAQSDQDKLKSQTKGQAQSDQDKLKGQAPRDQDKLKSQAQGQAPRDQDKAKSQTQGQAPREQERQGQTQQGQTQQSRPQQGQTTQPGQTQQGQTTQQGVREGGGGNVTVSFTTEQRTRIRETVFKERNAPRVSKVDFSIREGIVVPRSVRVVEVPDVIIEVHPQWRGYKYFIVNEELVIVDPATLRIVAIIDV